MLLGFDKQIKAYWLLESLSQQILISKDVMYDKTKLGFQHITTRQNKISFQNRKNHKSKLTMLNQ